MSDNDYTTQPPPTQGTTTSTTTLGNHPQVHDGALAHTGISPWSIIIFSAFLLFFGILALIGRDSRR